MVIKSSSGSFNPSQEHYGGGESRSPATPTMEIPELRLDMDSAIIDEPDEEEGEVKLKHGYRGGGSVNGSEDESEEESADALVAKQVERRGAKEG